MVETIISYSNKQSQIVQTEKGQEWTPEIISETPFIKTEFNPWAQVQEEWHNKKNPKYD